MRASDRAVVVTGVSSGIGHCLCLALAAGGFQVFGSVRKPEHAQALQQTLGEHFTPLLFDVVDSAAVQAAAAQVRERLAGRRLAGLINNAGIAVAGPLAQVPLADLRRQLEVNVLGTLAVTQAFLPLLGTDPALQGPCGRIINISSVTGRIATPFLGPYVASKHALEGLSDTLRRELKLYGIPVVIVAPGVVRTPIWSKPESMDLSAYQHLPVYREALPAFLDFCQSSDSEGIPVEKVAQTIVHALQCASPAARYAMMPKGPLQWLVMRLLPTRVMDFAVARRFALKPPG